MLLGCSCRVSVLNNYSVLLCISLAVLKLSQMSLVQGETSGGRLEYAFFLQGGV